MIHTQELQKCREQLEEAKEVIADCIALMREIRFEQEASTYKAKIDALELRNKNL